MHPRVDVSICRVSVSMDIMYYFLKQPFESLHRRLSFPLVIAMSDCMHVGVARADADMTM